MMVQMVYIIKSKFILVFSKVTLAFLWIMFVYLHMQLDDHFEFKFKVVNFRKCMLLNHNLNTYYLISFCTQETYKIKFK